MRPKSEIYTPKRDDEHPRLFHMGVPPPESKHIPLVRAQLKTCVAHFQTNGIYHFVGTGIFFGTENGNGLEL